MVPFRTKVSSTKRSVDCSVVVLPFFSCFLLSFFLALGHLCFCGGGVEEVGNILVFEVLGLNYYTKFSIRLFSLYPLSLQVVLFC